MATSEELELLALIADLSPTGAAIDRKDLLRALGEIGMPIERASMTLVRLQQEGLIDNQLGAINAETDFRVETDARHEILMTPEGADLAGNGDGDDDDGDGTAEPPARSA